MLFDKKVKKIVDVEKAEEEFEKNMEKEGLELEKNDRLAMILAAFAVFIPVLLLVIFGFLFVIWFFFLRHLP